MKYLQTSLSQKKGFTLVEMIVSVSIFAIVALVALGALLKIVDVNKKAQSLKTTINSVNFMLESMSREMRVGTRYYCGSSFSFTAGNQLTPTSCNFSSFPSNNSSWYIAFHSARTMPKVGGGTCNLIHYYRFAFNIATQQMIELIKYEQPNCETGSAGFTNLGYVNTNDLYFTGGSMIVNSSTTYQPFVKWHFVGYSGLKEKNRTYFNIQTSVSQRIAN